MRLALTVVMLLVSLNATAIVTNLVGLNNLVGESADEFRDSIDQINRVLLALESKANEDIRNRINQVDTVVNKTILQISALQNRTTQDVERILKTATRDLQNLEKTFMAHLSELIEKAECAAGVITLTDLERALGDFGDVLNTHRIKVSAPELYPDEKHKTCTLWLFYCPDFEREFEIKEPFNVTYVEIRDFLLDRLSLADDKTQIDTLVTSYEYIADLANRSSCLAPSSADRLRTEYVKYLSKARHWKYVLGNDIGIGRK